MDIELNKVLDLSFEEYCAIPAINASAIKHAPTPDHLRAWLAGEMESGDSAEKRFGRAMHCRVLEPDAFEGRFELIGQCTATLKTGANSGKRCSSTGSFVKDGECWCGQHKPDGARIPVEYVTKDEKDRIEQMAAKLKTSAANQYLAGPGYREAVIVWEHRELLMKTRIDKLSVDGTSGPVVIVDLKGCRAGNADEKSCRDACWRYDYHIQACMNISAAMAVFGKQREYHFNLLFLEKTPPYQSLLLPADDDDLTIAKRTINARLDAYKACRDSGNFHGYQPFEENVHSGLLPLWVKREHQQGERYVVRN